MGGVIVLGAGLSGLGCARHLPGCRVYEAASHVGGHAHSSPLGGVHFDQGAHICHSRDEAIIAMISRTAGEVVAIQPSIVRNRRQGVWLTYPVQNNLHELPLHLRIAALTDLVEAHVQPASEPADYRSWCLQQYGRTLTEQFYDEFTRKYWRVGASELATDWLSGRLLPSMLPRIIQGAFHAAPESQAVFARFLYPARGGFFGFFESLYEGLAITCGRPAVEIDPRRKRVSFASGQTDHYDYLASSIPLPELVRILVDVPPEVRDAAEMLRCTQLLCVNLVIGRPRLTDCHWFYIYDREIEAARVSLPTNLAPAQAPGLTAVQAEVFRRDTETFDAANLVELTAKQMGAILGFDQSEILELGHHHIRRAYVLSDRRRAAAVAAITEWLEDRDILTMGLYGRWKYIWSDEAYRQGRRTAEIIQERLTARKAG
jgi:protoporphyrinogen oxidase